MEDATDMQITLKTGGLLTRHLPEGTEGRSAEVDVPDGSSVVDALDALGIERDGRFLLSVNSKAVRPDDRAAYMLNEGDTLSLLPPLKGG